MAEKPLGNLFVRVAADVSGFVKGMTKVETASNKVRTGFRDLGKNVSSALAGIGLAKLAQDTLAIGVNAGEAASKFNAVFGEMTDTTQDFVDAFVQGTELTNSQAQELIANTGGIAQGLGLSEAAASDLAIQAAKLARDMASFNNVPIERTSKAISSALAGETEALKGLQVVIKQADVTTRALADTGKTLASELTKEERALATFALTVEGANKQVGDFARTQGDAAAQQKALMGELLRAQEDIGKTLVPVWAKFLELVAGGFARLKDAAVGFVGVLARVKLWWAKTFGDDSDFKVALDNMHFATIAMREMREESAALAEGVGDLIVPQQQAAATTARLADEIEFTIRPIIGMTRAITDFGRIAPIMLDQATEAAIRAGASMQTLDQIMTRTTDVILAAAQASASLIDIWKSEEGFWNKLGSTLQSLAPGLALIPGIGPILGAGAAIGGTLLKLFEHGGPIAPGQVGIVGEAGPELVEGPAQVTPMKGGMMGGLTINIVTESGRKLVDSIKVKDARDGNMRRVIRVPIAAVATG